MSIPVVADLHAPLHDMGSAPALIRIAACSCPLNSQWATAKVVVRLPAADVRMPTAISVWRISLLTARTTTAFNLCRKANNHYCSLAGDAGKPVDVLEMVPRNVSDRKHPLTIAPHNIYCLLITLLKTASSFFGS